MNPVRAFADWVRARSVPAADPSDHDRFIAAAEQRRSEQDARLRALQRERDLIQRDEGP